MSANPNPGTAARPVAIHMQKLGEHRGNRRLWIEGAKLSRAGIGKGDRFSVAWDAERGVAILKFGERGDRVVSGRERHNRTMPVIDVAGSALEGALGEGLQRAQVTIFRGRIEVAVHPDDKAARERIGRLVDKVRRGEPLLTGSLAHGGGVLDHAIHTGLEEQGIRTEMAFAVEMDQSTIDAAATRNPIWGADTLEIHAPLEEVPPSLLPRVDILIAGLPCTGASKSGKAKNQISRTEAHPTSGALVVGFLRIVAETQPALVALENVPDYAFSASAQLIRTSLETWGYRVHETVLEGNAFGALEDRRRLCLLGVAPSLDVALDRLVPMRAKEESLSAILEDIGPDDERWRSFAHHVVKEARDRAQGSNFKLNLVTADAARVGTMGAGYSKDRATEPHLRHPVDPSKARLLTPTEHARAKTIPPELVEGVTPYMAHQILGNSVIWEAWRSVGRHMGAAIAHVAGVETIEGDATFASILEELPALNFRVDPEAEELDEEIAPSPGMGM